MGSIERTSIKKWVLVADLGWIRFTLGVLRQNVHDHSRFDVWKDALSPLSTSQLIFHERITTYIKSSERTGEVIDKINLLLPERVVRFNWTRFGWSRFGYFALIDLAAL